MSMKVRRLMRTSSGSSTDSASSKSSKLENLFKRKSSISKAPEDKEKISPSASKDSVSPAAAAAIPARIPVTAAESDAPVRGQSMSSYSLFHSVGRSSQTNPSPRPTISLFAKTQTVTAGGEWNAPASVDATKRATAFPSRLFISMKPLEIVDDTAGAAQTTTFAGTEKFRRDQDEEPSLSNSFAGAGGSAGGSISEAFGQRRNVNGPKAVESGSIADRADAEDASTSQADYDEDMKTIAGDVASLLDDSTAGAGGFNTMTSDSETINGICKHFLRGKCRFREKCRNSHAIDNCVHCNAKLPKSRLAASAHLSKCYKAKYGGGGTATASATRPPAVATYQYERSENQEEADGGEVSLFEALSLH
jgi:hypothetical protein